MTMIPVDSTDLSSVGYESGTLYVRFHSGGLYSYDNVPVSVFDELLYADSKGKYFNQFIKNCYTYHKIS